MSVNSCAWKSVILGFQVAQHQLSPDRWVWVAVNMNNEASRKKSGSTYWWLHRTYEKETMGELPYFILCYMDIVSWVWVWVWVWMWTLHSKNLSNFIWVGHLDTYLHPTPVPEFMSLSPNLSCVAQPRQSQKDLFFFVSEWPQEVGSWESNQWLPLHEAQSPAVVLTFGIDKKSKGFREESARMHRDNWPFHNPHAS